MATYGATVAEATELETKAAAAAEKASFYGTIVTDLTAKVDTGGSLRDQCLIDVIRYAQSQRDMNREQITDLREGAERLRSQFGRRP